MLKMNKNRKKIEFEYEFEDGLKENFVYKQPNTAQIREALSIKDGDIKAQIDFTIKILKENIEGNNINKLIQEQEHSNIFDFKETLDDELGKQNKRK